MTYQRPAGVWSLEDKQCLIDTIMRDEPMPIFFLNKNSIEQKFYIVDGQQRLSCIKEFYDDKFKLNPKFSDSTISGKKYSDLDKKSQEKFLSYTLQTKVLRDYDDDRVRLIFSRLQRGKPLRLGERINALPGDTIKSIRKLVKHKFFDAVEIKNERYEFFPDVARILFFETYGFRDCGTESLMKFLDEKRDITDKSDEFKSAQKKLNYLALCFQQKELLNTHAWVLTVYTFISELMIKKALTGNQKTIHDFVKNFYMDIHDPDTRQSDRDLQTFYDNMRGSFTQKIMKIRNDIMVEQMLNSTVFDLPDIDIERQISDSDKQAVFAKNKGRCFDCEKEFLNYKEPEYHHVVRYADGGQTDIENIIPLCKVCHNKRHTSDKKLSQVSRNINFADMNEEDCEEELNED